MADNEIKTTLSLDLKLRNKKEIDAFEKAMKNVAKSVSDMMSEKSAGKFATALGTSARAMEKLTKTQTSLLDKRLSVEKQIIEERKKARLERKKETDEEKRIADEARQERRREQQQSKAYFTRGLIQGMGGPMFLSGKAPFRQTAGYLAGSALAAGGRAARGGFNSLFNGQQGFEQMLGAIPGVGGLASAAFSNAMGAAQQSLAYRQQFQGFMSSGAVFGTPSPTLNDLKEFNDSPRARAIIARAQAEANRKTRVEKTGIRSARSLDAIFQSNAQTEEVGLTEDERRPIFERAIEQRDELERRFMRETRLRDFERNIRMAGESVGLSLDRAGAIAGQTANVMGVDRFSAEGMNAQRTAVMASNLGIGPNTIGQFGYMANRQGVDTEREFMTAFIGAFKSGLEDSRVPQLLEAIAGEIAQTRQTGAAFNTAARLATNIGLANAGLSPEVAAAAGAGLSATGRRIGSGNIQGMDWEFLREFGGLRKSGMLTPDDLLEAKMRVESGDLGGKQNVQRAIGSFINRAGGGTAGATYLQSLMQQFGVTLSAGSVRSMANVAAGGELPDDVFRALTRGNASVDRMREGDVYTGTVSDQVVRAAQQSNERIADAGRELIDSYQDLASAQNNAMVTVSKFAIELGNVTVVLADLSKQVNRWLGSFGTNNMSVAAPEN